MCNKLDPPPSVAIFRENITHAKADIANMARPFLSSKFEKYMAHVSVVSVNFLYGKYLSKCYNYLSSSYYVKSI